MQSLQPYFDKWCVWRFGPTRDDGKRAKLPISPGTGRPARTNDASTFDTYDAASSSLATGRYEGLGVLMNSGRGVVCLDIDNCLDQSGEPNSIAAWALENFAGYVEVSQSGRGLHFFMQAEIPQGCREKVSVDGASLELYGSRSTRFICTTGNMYRGVGAVLEEQAALLRLIDRVSLSRDSRIDTDTDNDNDARITCKRSMGGAAVEGEEEHSDSEVMRLLRQNNKRGRVTRLLQGDISDYDGDNSRADLALASEIAYYSTNPDQVERLITASALGARGKWRERAEYRARTVAKALDGARSSYWEERRAKVEADRHANAARCRRAAFLQIDADQLILTSKGQIASNVSNAVRVLVNDARTCGLVAFNEFSSSFQVVHPLRPVFGVSASESLGELQEPDLTPIRTWLMREYGIDLAKGDVYDAVADWARHNRFNPVVQRLNTLASSWDGVPRLDYWLTNYLGVNAESSPQYVRDAGRKWLIGAVARAMRPGCKMDTVLVLEGGQGAGKSTAARVLAETVYPGGFVDSVPMLGDRQEAARALSGAFIVELAELTTFRRAEAELVKSFLTTQEDRVREPYARRYENRPRTCVFVGTTNEVEYNPDTSGGRRFWSVQVARIDLVRLKEDAPLLWGEAVTAYHGGEPWHLQDELAIKQAMEHAKNRMLSDTWDDAVRDFTEKLSNDTKYGETWSLLELFEQVFLKDSLNARNVGDQKRFANSLRRAGFAQRKSGGRMRWYLLPPSAPLRLAA